jgi:hypothetical protein
VSHAQHKASVLLFLSFMGDGAELQDMGWEGHRLLENRGLKQPIIEACIVGSRLDM